MMDAGLSPARKARAKHRLELRTLTYVTLDEANGGIVRNVNHEGIGVQAVTAVRPRQQLRVRFELSYPRLKQPRSEQPRSNYLQSNYLQSNQPQSNQPLSNQPRLNHLQSSRSRLCVEGRGEVVWANSFGQCGIRFVDLPPGMTRQINEWIFGNLLEGIALHAEKADSMFAGGALSAEGPFRGSALGLPGSEGDDGLMISATPLKVIELPVRADLPLPAYRVDAGAETGPPLPELDWLSQPLSGRSLVWTVNTLVALAALLLFVLVFLSVTGEPPRWPLGMMGGAALFVTALYWGFFRLFGGASPGARLARLVGSNMDEDLEAGDDRFR
jgi:hypothetical protein